MTSPVLRDPLGLRHSRPSGFDCVRMTLICKYYSAELLRLALIHNSTHVLTKPACRFNAQDDRRRGCVSAYSFVLAQGVRVAGSLVLVRGADSAATSNFGEVRFTEKENQGQTKSVTLVFFLQIFKRVYLFKAAGRYFRLGLCAIGVCRRSFPQRRPSLRGTSTL